MGYTLPSARPRLACRTLPPERFLLRNVHLFDPAEQVNEVGDLLVAEGRIVALGPTRFLISRGEAIT
ncbi:MAG: hypothetical protein H5T84_01455, partial [Thermoleophilia bacterium]|nr:hypothetical protein [Thermoleophilia bacterium]